jgi:hypothetical protein
MDWKPSLRRAGIEPSAYASRVAKQSAHDESMHDSSIPLWPLPLAIALILVLAVHLAWLLSLQAGHVPSCIPYLEGCTSISRAARHGLGNHLFRLLVLPCALLVGLHWWLAARWLRREGTRGGEVRMILLLGVMAATALALYATFLGSEGEAYRFLRRYGVVVYFGASYLAQLLFLRGARRQGRLGLRIATAMVAICVAMLALGVANVTAEALLADADLQDRLENALEWQLGVLLVGWYVAHAVLWHGSGYRMRLELGTD